MPRPDSRRFNALLATASINDAIEYYKVFEQLQAERQADDPEFVPLKIAAVFSPPAEGNQDVRQIQEDLPQEKEDNRHDPAGKKTALKAIVADYNQQYGSNHDINNFDLYYQDISSASRTSNSPTTTCPARALRRSTSPSSSKCFSPASTPCTSTRSTSTRTSSTTA